MHVDPPEAFAVEFFLFDQCQHFFVICLDRPRQTSKIFEKTRALSQVSASQFPHHGRVHQDPTSLQKGGELTVADAQVMNPNGRVSKHQHLNELARWKLAEADGAARAMRAGRNLPSG